MGRRKNISSPMMIDTLFAPLIDSFDIVQSDTLEQWFYVNKETNQGTIGVYSPDRTETPLILTPTIKAVDKDTNEVYTPSFSTLQWFITIGNGSEAEVTSVTATDDFYLSGNNLVVRKYGKLAPGTDPIKCRCAAVYVDPRNLAPVSVGNEVLLTVSQDATQDMPDITLNCEKMVPFNPLRYNPNDVSSSSLRTITAKVMLGDKDLTADSQLLWTATDDIIKTETNISATVQDGGVARKKFPCFVSATGATLTVDMMYTERINIICRVMNPDTNQPYPAKAYATLRWVTKDIKGITYSKQGAAVDSTSGDKTFELIVNMDGETLSEDIKDAHLAYNWKSRKTSVSSLSDKGWGKTLLMRKSELKNNKENGIIPTTLVHADIYLLGAYEHVTQDGEAVTQNGEIVYQRPI